MDRLRASAEPARRPPRLLIEDRATGDLIWTDRYTREGYTRHGHRVVHPSKVRFERSRADTGLEIPDFDLERVLLAPDDAVA